jgi:uncharacterized membrane protein YidH (DUF202 family)
MDFAAFTGIPWIARHPVAYPALEMVHIAGIALLLGSLVLLELRLWGVAAELPVVPLARLALAVTASGFALAAASGLLMFAANPAELLANRFFLIKMGLLTLAGCNAVLFHTRGGLRRQDTLARAQTVLSVGIWLGAIICGRWMAYS